MSRSNRSPITPEGGLRNYLDQLLLAALAIGLLVDTHCAANDESKEAAHRALQRLTEVLEVNGRYAVLVWAMNRELLDIETLCAGHPREIVEVWLRVAQALEASPLEERQVDLLISYTALPQKTLHTHWSQPGKHPEIKEILDQVCLPGTGQGAYAIVLSAAAYLMQVRWEAIPGPEASTITAPNGVRITLSGAPGLVLETKRVIRAALGPSR
ncbi:MAG TPA: hypothetical protein VMS08_01690 [Candidatus Saccharimonadia bacterium]|nr:hypothetical protein [Candidatus Saccharimonadia bacterium]